MGLCDSADKASRVSSEQNYASKVMNPATRKLIEKRFGKIKIYPDGFRVSQALYRGSSGQVKPIAQGKPWGGEIWLIFTKRYAFKILFIEKGQRFSLQMHRKKEESWLVAAGHPLVILDKKKFLAKPGMIFHVGPRTIHRIEAKRDSAEIWEVSTAELHDAVRLSDDYKRVGKKYNPK